MSNDDSLPEIILSQQTIGFIERGEIGKDEYLLVKRDAGSLPPNLALRLVKLKAHKPLKEVGGYYCVNVSAVPYPGDSSAAIVIVQRRYDV